MSILARSWNGKSIRQRADGYINGTDMAQATNKRVHDWMRLNSTTDYLQALEVDTGIPALYQGDTKHLVEGEQSLEVLQSGTWLHSSHFHRFCRQYTSRHNSRGLSDGQYCFREIPKT